MRLFITSLLLLGFAAQAHAQLFGGDEEARRRIETLRRVAYSTSPKCTSGSFANGGPVTNRGVTESWQVIAGSPRTIRVIVSYKAVHGTHTDSLVTQIWC